MPVLLFSPLHNSLLLPFCPSITASGPLFWASFYLVFVIFCWFYLSISTKPSSRPMRAETAWLSRCHPAACTGPARHTRQMHINVCGINKWILKYFQEFWRKVKGVLKNPLTLLNHLNSTFFIPISWVIFFFLILKLGTEIWFLYIKNQSTKIFVHINFQF